MTQATNDPRWIAHDREQRDAYRDHPWWATVPTDDSGRPVIAPRWQPNPLTDRRKVAAVSREGQRADSGPRRAASTIDPTRALGTIVAGELLDRLGRDAVNDDRRAVPGLLMDAAAGDPVVTRLLDALEDLTERAALVGAMGQHTTPGKSRGWEDPWADPIGSGRAVLARSEGSAWSTVWPEDDPSLSPTTPVAASLIVRGLDDPRSGWRGTSETATARNSARRSAQRERAGQRDAETLLASWTGADGVITIPPRDPGRPSLARTIAERAAQIAAAAPTPVPAWQAVREAARG